MNRRTLGWLLAIWLPIAPLAAVRIDEIEGHDDIDEDAPTLSEMRPTLPFIPKEKKARPTFELKMPTLGRKRGRRRVEV